MCRKEHPSTSEEKLRLDFLKKFDERMNQFSKDGKMGATEKKIQKNTSMFRMARCTISWSKANDIDMICVHDSLSLIGLWGEFKESGILLSPAEIVIWEKGFQTLYTNAKDDANKAEFVIQLQRNRAYAASDINQHLSRIETFVHPQGGTDPSSVWEEGTDQRPFLWSLSSPIVWNALTLYMETKHKPMIGWREMKEARTERYQRRLKDSKPPAFFGHIEVLAMIVERLPMPSAGRLATVCIWLRGHIIIRQLIAKRNNTRFRHGMYHLAGERGITLRRVASMTGCSSCMCFPTLTY